MSTKKKKLAWSKKWGKESICPITQSRMRPGKDKNGTSYVIQISCGHRFYRKALIAWYMGSFYEPRCPLCSYKIKPEELT